MTIIGDMADKINERRKEMSRRDIWAYNPDVCDGDYCPMNCDYCSKRENAQEANGDFDDEPDDSQLEMGFNPYEGAYDYDC